MNEISNFEYIAVRGKRANNKLQLYALSTCAFCEKAMNFLNEYDYSYEYLFIDLLDLELKKRIKNKLKEQNGHIRIFPILIINDSTIISGFIEQDWRRALNIE